MDEIEGDFDRNQHIHHAIQTINNSIGWTDYSHDLEFIFEWAKDFYDRSFIAYCQEEPIGYLVCTDLPEKEPKDSYFKKDLPHYSYIAYLAVRSDYQGQGIGTALMEETMFTVVALGKMYLCLHCHPNKEGFYLNFAASEQSCNLPITGTSEVIDIQYEDGDSIHYVVYNLEGEERAI